MMELRQLTYFLAAAHTQNFRQAAELCLVTQPALSRQIAALEKEINMMLFTREKQHVKLTAAGQTFAQYARDALELLHQGQQEFTRWQDGQSGTILIGCNPSLAAAFLPPLLATFRGRYPDIHLKVNIHHSDNVIALVERGEVDLGFIYDPAVRSDVVHIRELFRQPLCLLAPANHPLAQVEDWERTLARVVLEPLVLPGETARLRKVLDHLFLQRGISVKPVIEIESIEGLRELVRLGCGVALIPPALLWQPQSSNELVLLPLADVAETFIFALVYSRIGSLTPCTRHFMQMIIENNLPQKS